MLTLMREFHLLIEFDFLLRLLFFSFFFSWRYPTPCWYSLCIWRWDCLPQPWITGKCICLNEEIRISNLYYAAQQSNPKAWYYGYIYIRTMLAKPMKTLILRYPMIQALIIDVINMFRSPWNSVILMVVKHQLCYRGEVCL